MVYFLETKLLEPKSLVYSLQNVFGIGKYQALKLCKQVGYSSNLLVENLSEDQISKLLKLIEGSDLKVSTDLKKFKLFVSKQLIDIKSYKGLRKVRGLPIRGQRTHTNANTAKQIRI